MTQNLERILLSVISVLSILIVLLDFTGALDSIPWFNERRLVVLCVLILGMMCGYMVVERRLHLVEIERKTEKGFKVINDGLEKLLLSSNSDIGELSAELKSLLSGVVLSLNGVEVKLFEKDVDLLEYLLDRLPNAQEVSDLTWEESDGDGSGHTKERKKLEEMYQEMISELSADRPYREIFVFNRKDRILKLKDRLNENKPLYSCAYYPHATVPLLQYILIDDEAIFSSDELPVLCAIRHPLVVKILRHYYDAAWSKSTKIKVKETTYDQVVDHIYRTN